MLRPGPKTAAAAVTAQGADVGVARPTAIAGGYGWEFPMKDEEIHWKRWEIMYRNGDLTGKINYKHGDVQSEKIGT